MNKIKRTFGFIFSHPLGKRHPFKSIIRFITWQLQISISPAKLRVKNFIKPVKFYARKGLTGITGNIYTGLHEFNDMAFLLHFLRQDDVFFDIGSNVGSYTLLASGVIKARSTALEPVPSTFDILTANINLNKLQHVVNLVNAGAGAKTGKIAFTSGEDTTNHAVAEHETGLQDIINVPIVTVDSLLANGSPALIKMDAEGYESEIINGMTATLDQPVLKAIIIELNGSGERYGFDESKIHDLLLSKGFNPYHYDPFKRSLSAIDSFGNYNTIYCRDVDMVDDRIRSAKKVIVMGELI